MKENLQIIFGLFGGLAVFIFGMNMMSECLQKVAGERMKQILALLTKNPILGVLAGALTTAVLQSSSATTVMAIGFVSAGLMNLPQAISIIFGANIGTTMTAQLIAFKISDYIYAIIFIGFLVFFVGKSEKIKSIGQTVFSFGLLFLGIETMGSVMKPLAESPIFTDLIGRVSDIPVLGVLVGTLMTLVVQSSSATIAVLQNFAEQAGPDGVTSIIGLAGAIPILLGDNIGTTITALMASIGQSRDAKRTALAHCIFNISGTCIFIWFVKPFAWFIQNISPKGPEVEVISRQIANAHTTFNVVMTIIWVPLIWLMVKIVMRILPEKSKAAEFSLSTPVYLDEKLLGQPTAALQLVAKEVLHFGDVIAANLNGVEEAVRQDDRSLLQAVSDRIAQTNRLAQTITEYLSNLFSGGVLTEEQAGQSTGFLYVLSDMTRINELCSEVVRGMEERETNRYKYSKEAMENLTKSLSTIQEMYADSLSCLLGHKETSAEHLVKLKGEVSELDTQMRRAHMKRVAKGKCSPNLTTPFSNLLLSIDRMSNSCLNLADAAINHQELHYFLQNQVN